MMASRWLILPFCASLAALGFAACTGAEATGASSSGGGAGGAVETSSSASSGAPSSGSAMPEAGPLTCKGSYTNVPPGECDLLAQDCGPGRTCRPTQLTMGGPWTTACNVAPGIKSEGAVCYTATECRSGLHCIAGRCAPFCCPTSGEPCLGGVCGFTVQFGGGAVNVRGCRYSQQCEVLVPDACPPGYDCRIDDFMYGLATCGSPSSTPVGEYQLCDFSNDCDNMQQCITAAPYPKNRCYTLCWATGPKAQNPKGLGGCDAIDSCELVVNLGLDNLGLCVPKNGIPDAGGGG